MNAPHKDIDKIIPFGEFLRGFINQRYITATDIARILRERGIFVFNQDKDYMVPIMQNLLLSPAEFDKVRDSFSEKEDNEKKFSREITWAKNAKIFDPELLFVSLDEVMRTKLPTCKLRKPVSFVQLDNNPNHIIASFELERHDMNKSWYEQTNLFHGSIEFINDNGKGHVRITHTAPETKDLAEEILNIQVKRYKQKGTIPLEVTPKKILISGDSLDKTFFMSEKSYHSSLVLWNIEAVFSFDYKGEKGTITICLGFPDYNKKMHNAEFEITIRSLNIKNRLTSKAKKTLESKLLSEMDKQKSLVYSNFIEYLNNQKK